MRSRSDLSSPVYGRNKVIRNVWIYEEEISESHIILLFSVVQFGALQSSFHSNSSPCLPLPPGFLHPSSAGAPCDLVHCCLSPFSSIIHVISNLEQLCFFNLGGIFNAYQSKVNPF